MMYRRTTDFIMKSINRQVTNKKYDLPSSQNFAGETIGVIEVLNKKAGRFTKDNLLFVEAAASRAKSIQNAQNAGFTRRGAQRKLSS